MCVVVVVGFFVCCGFFWFVVFFFFHGLRTAAPKKEYSCQILTGPCWPAKADSVFQGHGWLCAGSLGQGMEPAGGLVSEVLSCQGRMGNHHLHTCCGLPRNLCGHIPLFHFFHD